MLLKRQQCASSGPDARVKLLWRSVHSWLNNKPLQWTCKGEAQDGANRRVGTCQHEPRVVTARKQQVLQTRRTSEKFTTQGGASRCDGASWRDGQGSFNVAGGTWCPDAAKQHVAKQRKAPVGASEPATSAHTVSSGRPKNQGSATCYLCWIGQNIDRFEVFVTTSQNASICGIFRWVLRSGECGWIRRWITQLTSWRAATKKKAQAARAADLVRAILETTRGDAHTLPPETYAVVCFLEVVNYHMQLQFLSPVELFCLNSSKVAVFDRGGFS